MKEQLFSDREEIRPLGFSTLSLVLNKTSFDKDELPVWVEIDPDFRIAWIPEHITNDSFFNLLGRTVLKAYLPSLYRQKTCTCQLQFSILKCSNLKFFKT